MLTNIATREMCMPLLLVDVAVEDVRTIFKHVVSYVVGIIYLLLLSSESEVASVRLRTWSSRSMLCGYLLIACFYACKPIFKLCKESESIVKD
jgi:hypothetical protein